MPAARVVAAVYLLLTLLSTAFAHGRDYLNQSATLDVPTSRIDEFPIELDGRASVTLEARIALREGRLRVELLDPGGKVLHSFAAGQLQGTPISTTLDKGTYTLKVAAENAQGTWSIRADDRPIARPWPTAINFAPGGLMMAVAIGAAIACRIATGERWRWFWAGALLWTVAILAKIALAVPLNGPLLGALKAHLPNTAYIAVGSAYIGLLTGITEVAIVLFAGLIWRKLAATRQRALMIGTGAGAFEALLLGVAGFITPLALAVNNMEVPAITVSTMFVPPFERVIAILAHIAVRVMTLYAVATRRWRWFWGAFVLFSALDGVAGFYHLSGMVATTNPWLLELGLLPFGIVSVVLLWLVLRRWRAAESIVIAPEEASLPQT